MTDLMGGQVDIMCDQTTNTSAQIEGGKVKGYAKGGKVDQMQCSPRKQAAMKGR
jgi:tripartite-type tricarboxylate transporter receptor subunit TctC